LNLYRRRRWNLSKRNKKNPMEISRMEIIPRGTGFFQRSASLVQTKQAGRFVYYLFINVKGKKIGSHAVFGGLPKRWGIECGTAFSD
jgi:hypothetical protein